MDILDEMTKDEIIGWIRDQVAYTLRPPKKSGLLWSRWLRQKKKMFDRREANIKAGRSLNLAKRDEIAKQVNATGNIKIKLQLMKKMKPYEKQWQLYLTESQLIMKAEKKLDKLHAQYEIERIKENNQG